jgi:hypothetical protein
MRCGGVYSAACREEVLKGDYKEASTGDMVRHDGGRALSRRPAGRPEGPCSHALRRRCRGQKRRSEGVSAAIYSEPNRSGRGGKRERVEGSLDPPTALW